MHEIIFEHNKENNHLKVTIETKRLYLDSVLTANLEDYKDLLGNFENLNLYRDGKPFTTVEIESRFNEWIKRWQNNIPFSAFAVSKKEDEKFIGHLTLGYAEDDLPGCAELAYIFKKNSWGQGYGKEAVTTVVKNYVPELAHRHYKIKGHDFTSVIAMTHTNNKPSVEILTAADMKIRDEKEIYGHNRYVFFAKVTDLVEAKPQAHSSSIPSNIFKT